MERLFDYDSNSPKSIEKYAEKLIGHTFNEVEYWAQSNSEIKEENFTYDSKSRKGGLGNFIEERFFGYKANSDSRADFSEAGVEIKVTPYEIKSNNKLTAGERLVLTMINFDKKVEKDFYKSHLWEKCKLMLLIFYLRNKALASNMDYRIDYVSLFTFPQKDMVIILNDYKIINDKIEAGKAHELSESDTIYLGACTKGSTAAKSWVTQYYNSEEKAKKRAYCLKNSYMTYVLNNYIVPGVRTYEESIVTIEELQHESFSDVIMGKLSKYEGMTEDNIAKELGIEVNKKNKSYEASLVYKMLGVKNNRIEEFEKAGIVVKIIKYRKNKKDNQEFRLEDINFIELDNERMDYEIRDDEGNPIGWENSELYEILDRKYLFTIFWEEEGGSIFKGSQLWGMPDWDKEVVRKAWNKTKKIVREGVKLKVVHRKKQEIVVNNLPGLSDNGIFHIRPHASKRYYKLADGTEIGNGTISDSDLLPSGERILRQAYWLNRSYIDSQISEKLRRNY